VLLAWLIVKLDETKINPMAALALLMLLVAREYAFLSQV
jgi:hypothetical protein